MRHTALLNQQRQEWEARNHNVYVEGQNAFRLRGKSATLAGRPDLVVLDERDATIIDVKTGREQPWHRIQVMIYQYALPLALPQYRNVRIGGEVIYPSHTVRIPRGALPRQFIENLGALIRRLAAETPARRVPSRQECRFCDISAADCPERVDREYEADGGTTTDFSTHRASCRQPFLKTRTEPRRRPNSASRLRLGISPRNTELIPVQAAPRAA